MSCRRRTSFCTTLLLLAVWAYSPPVRAETGFGRVPDVRVWDETNRNVQLSTVLGTAEDAPVILLPVYARCAASCPILTRKLKEETARMGPGTAYRVVMFSFDPNETAENLQSFRKQEEVPANWVMVRADEAEIRRFFDFFHYSVMTEGGLLFHPNKIFLLDHDWNWRGTLTGVDWDSAELEKSLSRIDNPGLVGWIAMNPGKLALMGFGGLALSLGLILGWLVFHRARRHSVIT